MSASADASSSAAEIAEKVTLADVALPIPLPRALTLPRSREARRHRDAGQARALHARVAPHRRRRHRGPARGEAAGSEADPRRCSRAISLPEDLVVVRRAARELLPRADRRGRAPRPAARRQGGGARRRGADALLRGEGHLRAQGAVGRCRRRSSRRRSRRARRVVLAYRPRARRASALAPRGSVRRRTRDGEEARASSASSPSRSATPSAIRSSWSRSLRDTELAPTDPQQVAMDALAAALAPEKRRRRRSSSTA